MNLPAIKNKELSWTWADLVSSYRFWGLLLFYTFILMGVVLLSSFVTIYFNQERNVNPTEIGILLGLMQVSGLLGFYPAWVAIRWKPVPVLIGTTLLQLLGCLLLIVPFFAEVTLLRWVGAVFSGLNAGVIIIAVPAIISGGRGGVETFALSFGLVQVLSQIGRIIVPALMGPLWYGGTSLLRMLIGITLILGLFFLLPVKRSLFTGPPPQRDYAFAPKRRSPLGVAIFCLVPFYPLYWIYRIHGEVASLTSTRSILSPRAAVWISICVPFLIHPLLLASLNDALNQRAAETGKPFYRASWKIILYSFCLAPLAVALLQSSLNQATSEQLLEG